jgi:hypothetical protein
LLRKNIKREMIYEVISGNNYRFAAENQINNLIRKAVLYACCKGTIRTNYQKIIFRM